MLQLSVICSPVFCHPSANSSSTHNHSALILLAVAGTLVSQWATSTGLPRLTSLTLSDNQLAGPLPGAWGLLNRFTALQYLDLSGQ